MFASAVMEMEETVQIWAIFLISQCIELDHKLKDEGERETIKDDYKTLMLAAG